MSYLTARHEDKRGYLRFVKQSHARTISLSDTVLYFEFSQEPNI